MSVGGGDATYDPSRLRSRTRVQAAQQELICPICIETFSEPRTLACQHTFCTACLLQLAESAVKKTRGPTQLKSAGGENFSAADELSPPVMVACPECRANIVLPANGVLGERKEIPTLQENVKVFIEVRSKEKCVV